MSEVGKFMRGKKYQYRLDNKMPLPMQMETVEAELKFYKDKKDTHTVQLSNPKYISSLYLKPNKKKYTKPSTDDSDSSSGDSGGS